MICLLDTSPIQDVVISADSSPNNLKANNVMIELDPPSNNTTFVRGPDSLTDPPSNNTTTFVRPTGQNDSLQSLNIADSRQERSLGVTIASISVLFVICQSVKLVPTVYEIFICNPNFENMHFGQDPQKICQTTDIINKFIR